MPNLCIFVLFAFCAFLELSEASEACRCGHHGYNPFQDVLGEEEYSTHESDPMSYEFEVYVSKKVPWDYNTVRGPLHWDALHSDFTHCRTMGDQSPINIDYDISNATIACTLWPTNPEQSFIMLNDQTEKTIKLGPFKAPDQPQRTGSLFRERDFRLIDIHFHTPSEHRFMDMHYPVEAHFVMKNSQGHLMVRGIFFDVIDAREGSESNFWTAIAPALPLIPNHGDRTTIRNLNTRNIMRIFEDACLNRRVFNYFGSLTTPPCTPGISWHVLSYPLHISVSTYKRLRNIIKFNSRYTQNGPVNPNLLGLACGDPSPYLNAEKRK